MRDFVTNINKLLELMFNSTQKRRFQSSYLWFKRNDSIVLLDSQEDYQFYQILINVYTQNICSFIETHKNSLDGVEICNKMHRQNWNQKIGLKKLQQIFNKNEFKISKQILHRNENIKKSLQNYANTFPALSSSPQLKSLTKCEIKSKPQLPSKTRGNKEILIIEQGFKRQRFNKQIKYNRMSHIDKIYSSITSGIFSKNQVIYSEESRPNNFFSEKDRYVIVPNRIKMAKIASKIKKTNLSKRNFQDEDGLIKKQQKNKVSISLGDQIMTKFGINKNEINIDFSPGSTKRCLNDINKLKEKMDVNKTKQMEVFKSISKANLPDSVFITQQQGYRPKNRYFETIFQLS